MDPNLQLLLDGQYAPECRVNRGKMRLKAFIEWWAGEPGNTLWKLPALLGELQQGRSPVVYKEIEKLSVHVKMMLTDLDRFVMQELGVELPPAGAMQVKVDASLLDKLFHEYIEKLPEQGISTSTDKVPCMTQTQQYSL